jgi:excinuclease ABC subunit C
MKVSDLDWKALPDTPGVYFFRDAENNILYIGKATSLRSRVRSYFDADLQTTRGLKIVSMVQAAQVITWRDTSSALEALILEAKLIKEHQPYFNTREKDDRSFYSVVVTKEEYPRVLLMRTRTIEKQIPVQEQLEVFGPFTSGASLKEALKLVRKIFPYRDKCVPRSGIPCFNAQIGLCPGVCIGKVTPAEYANNIKKICMFFDGKTKELEKKLHQEMMALAEEQRFEEAAEIKRSLFSLTHIKDTSLIKRDNASDGDTMRIESYDAAHISGTSRVGVMTVVVGGVPEKSEYKKFKLDEGVNDDALAYTEMLTRRLAHTEWGRPDVIVVDGGLPQKNRAEQILKMLGFASIPVVSVVKDERHKPKGLLGPKEIVESYKRDIILANAESHRFAIEYHKLLRNKASLGIKKRPIKNP